MAEKYTYTFWSRGPVGEVRETVVESDIYGAVEANTQLAPGFVEIDETTYRSELAELDEAKRVRQEAVRAKEAAELAEAHAELTTLGLSAKAATRMTGFTPEAKG